MHRFNIYSISCSGLVLVIVWRWVCFETSLMLSYYIDHLHVCVQVKVCELTCSPRRPHRCCCSRCPCWPLLTAAHLTATHSLTDRCSPAACPCASRPNPSANPRKPRPVSRQCCLHRRAMVKSHRKSHWCTLDWLSVVRVSQTVLRFAMTTKSAIKNQILICSTLTWMLYILYWLIRACFYFSKEFLEQQNWYYNW